MCNLCLLRSHIHQNCGAVGNLGLKCSIIKWLKELNVELLQEGLGETNPGIKI